jgi:arylsulfatase A-like enzyme
MQPVKEDFNSPYNNQSSKIQIYMKSIKASSVLKLIFFIVFSMRLNAQEKPNIIIIMTDQQSADAMSNRLGSKYINTPNMDYLANNGVSFTNTYCANPLCVPSRSSIFTGRYPHEMGIQNNDEKLVDPNEFPSIGAIFRNAGYETGYVGKWHLPYDRNNLISHGFDFLPDKKGNGSDSSSPLKAGQFIQTKRNAPFLLVVSFMNPHNICQWARDEDLPDGAIENAPSPDSCPPLRANAMPSSDETDIMQLIRKSMQKSDKFPVGSFSNGKWRQYIWSYYRLIEKVDEQIGKVLATLRATGQEKNTLIVFTADHGDMQGAHRWNQKTVLYEEAAKVPLIFSQKGMTARRSEALVQSGIDILPTICDFAGIPNPTKSRGVSLNGIISKNNLSIDRKYVVVSDHLTQGEPVDGHKPEPEGRMIRNKEFKYWIYNQGKQRETLYDIQHDPGEMVNLVNNPSYQNQLKECRKQLMEWAKVNNDSFIKFLVN